ncbi:unnamed protein product [Citrullus colocynthis]|uniref:Uncharacterized protein n=1 Tax=Citrullus colocynthis TaxID=252529 RepID=A0ABP0XRI9_9ROSI
MAPNTKLAPLMAVLFMVMLVAAAVGCHASPPWTEEKKAESRSSSSIMIMRKFGYSKRQMEHLRKLSSSSTARYIPGGPDSQHHSHPPRFSTATFMRFSPAANRRFRSLKAKSSSFSPFAPPFAAVDGFPVGR